MFQNAVLYVYIVDLFICTYMQEKYKPIAIVHYRFFLLYRYVFVAVRISERH